MATPAGSVAAAAAPLKGTYGLGVEVDAEPSVEVIWPPVRFAPLGPIGRDVSVNAHVEDVQMHSPLIGSQNGVEQVDETERGGTVRKRWRRGEGG